jgi:hypothetical protein
MSSTANRVCPFPMWGRQCCCDGGVIHWSLMWQPLDWWEPFVLPPNKWWWDDWLALLICDTKTSAYYGAVHPLPAILNTFSVHNFKMKGQHSESRAMVGIVFILFQQGNRNSCVLFLLSMTSLTTREISGFLSNLIKPNRVKSYKLFAVYKWFWQFGFNSYKSHLTEQPRFPLRWQVERCSFSLWKIASFSVVVLFC